jgi:hypothetical protein
MGRSELRGLTKGAQGKIAGRLVCKWLGGRWVGLDEDKGEQTKTQAQQEIK